MIAPPARTLARPVGGSAGFAAFLSGLLPGLGQVYQERWVRGLLMLLLPPLAIALLVAFALIADPIAAALVRRAPLAVALVLGALFAYHLATVADAFSGGVRGARVTRPADAALLLVVALGLAVLYLSVYRQSSAWATLVASVFEPSGRAVPAGTPAGGAGAPGWSGTERLNVLLLGIDTREDDAATLNTDTVIVLSLDPASDSAVMLSIPRDTLVEIPGAGRDKVNSAYAHAGPQAGPELARRTVERFLGVPIHSYALIDFNAFRQTIDSVGGIVLDVRRPLRDEHYPTPDYGVERIRFLAGPQLMNGEEALRYARSRHDSNDFSRARRQQLVLHALRSRLAQVGIFRIPGVVERVGPLVRTNFDPGDAVPLARAVLGMDTSDIRSEVLLPCGGDEPHCELTEENGPGGYYLIPDQEKVRALVTELFGETTRTSSK